jgi:hypothetical protein
MQEITKYQQLNPLCDNSCGGIVHSWHQHAATI